MTRKHNLAKPRGGAKSASASGDTHASASGATRRRIRINSSNKVEQVGNSALASGDEHAAVLRRPAASMASISQSSASGDMARTMTSIMSHGVRVRCCAERRQELSDALQASRSSRRKWDPKAWGQEARAIRSKLGGLGLGTHGGSRAAGKRKFGRKQTKFGLCGGQ